VGFRAFVISAGVIISVWVAPFDQGVAQSLTAGSSGITATITKTIGGVISGQNQISAQMLLKNTNKVRVYLLDARTDDSQIAFLGSGEHLNPPYPAGIPFCNGSYPQCVANSSDMKPENFSYMEPGEELGFALKYTALQKVSDHDTISFSITFVAKFAKSDVNAEDVGPPKRVTLPFRNIPISSNNN